jgi:predicted alpha/beta superfamily hydrolase
MEEMISIGGQTANILHRDTGGGLFHVFDNFNIDLQPRKIEIFLPPGYENSMNRYPVIYMNDGQTAFEPGGLSPWYWNVDTTLNKFYEEDIILKVIVVAVSPISRVDEYLSIKQYIDFDNNIVDIAGGLPDYAKYLAENLKPFIDRNYRTDPNPKHTMIIGSSFGGTASFFISSLHPDAFGIAGVFSPSFTIGTGLQVIPQPIEKTKYIRNILAALKSCKTKPRLLIDWGGQEGDIGVRALEVIKLLKEKASYKENKNLFYMEDQIATHDERAWAYRFGLIMKQFYSKANN